MPQELDAEMLETLTPEERAAIEDDKPSAEELAAMQRIAADGSQDDEDDGDDDDADTSGTGTNAAPVEGKGATPAPAATPAANPPAADPAPAAAAAAEDPAIPPTTVTATYDAKLPSDYDDQVKSLATQEADLKAKFKSGEIDFDEFELQRGELLTKREELTLARAKAEISQEMTQQTAQSQWKATVDRFVLSAAKEDGGIDYRKDLAKQADLDQFVRVLAAREENADKPMDWFLSEAHRRVKALHGVTAAPAPKGDTPVDPAAAAKAANDARKPPVGAVPATLAQVPGGDGPGDVAGEFADIDALEGEALESAIAKLTPAQREKWARGR
jgi:hypothetical protein